MNTTFIISGGAGRVACAIPALEKYHRLNPNDDFKVLVHGWQDLLWSHPLLQDRTFAANQKGSFENHLRDNRVLHPEPYIANNFFNERINLIEAFDEIINETDFHEDLSKPLIHTSTFEKKQTANIIANIRNEAPNKKLVLFQPFGSSCNFVNDYPFDHTHRSLSPDQYVAICNGIRDLATIIYCSQKHLKPNDDGDNISITEWNPYFRVFPAFMEQSDYFIGCDSCGQHFAYGMNKPGTIIMGGSTDNFTYPYHFNVIRKKGITPKYSPIRLSDGDTDFVERTNDGIMELSNHEIQEIIETIRKDLSQ